jgi:hypothetical protein
MKKSEYRLSINDYAISLNQPLASPHFLRIPNVASSNYDVIGFDHNNLFEYSQQAVEVLT